MKIKKLNFSVKNIIIPLIVGLSFPNALNSGSLKDNFRNSFRFSEEYKFRTKLAKTCTVDKAQYRAPSYYENRQTYYCVFSDGTVGSIWKYVSNLSSSNITPRAKLDGVIDKPVSHNGKNIHEYSIEGRDLIRYSCWELTYDGECAINIMRTLVGIPKN